MSFQVIHGQQPFPDQVTKSIFMAGPIPRTAKTKYLSWKPEAYRLLEELGYDGVVYDPEWKLAPDQSDADYDESKQINWEVEAMNRADIIILWIPRQFPDMPALTSNIEFGKFFKTGKLILGYPESALKMGYITYRATKWVQDAYKWQVPVFQTLKETIQTALERIGDGALRRGVETKVPLEIWQDKTFQQWCYNLHLGGHKLEDFRVEYVYYRRQHEDGRPKRRVWVARPKVRVAEENRFKDNEVIVGRPATVSVLMYYKNNNTDVHDWRIVLVKEYRSAVMNERGLVYELPGGSIEPLDGPHNEQTITDSARREIQEEVGLFLDASRLCKFSVRQSMATLVACENHLYIYELNYNEYRSLHNSEITDMKQRANKFAPQIEDNSEYTVPVMVRVDELASIDGFRRVYLDWVNMGMIMSFVALEQSRSGALS